MTFSEKMFFKKLLLIFFVYFFCLVCQCNTLSTRQKKSGTADQELFHLLEKMKHRPNPVAGIIDVNRIGKRQPKSLDFFSKWNLKPQDDDLQWIYPDTYY